MIASTVWDKMGSKASDLGTYTPPSSTLSQDPSCCLMGGVGGFHLYLEHGHIAQHTLLNRPANIIAVLRDL